MRKRNEKNDRCITSAGTGNSSCRHLEYCKEANPSLCKKEALADGRVAEPPISPRTPPACVSPGFTNPRWLAALRSPGANFLHASGVQTSSRKGCSDISPGLSEAIPGVTATLYTDAR